MEQLLLILLNGLVYGMLLFMLSSGLTLIFGMLGVLNLAQASFYMLGAFLAYTISTRLDFWAALVLAPLMVGVLGAVVERYGLRAVHRHGHLAELLFTFGLAFIIGEIVPLIWGRSPVPYRVPASLDVPLFHIGANAYPAYRLFMMGVGLFMFVALFAALAKTRLGLVVRAALTHPEMVAMLGHDVPRVFTLVFGAGCALAGLAGVIAGNAFTTEPGMARALGAIVFAVVVMGGLGSIWGALAASLLIGFVQTASISLDLPLGAALARIGVHVDTSHLTDLWQVSIARVAPVVPYALLILVLVVRPRGLMGRRSA
ncbi:MAG TPA: branched-chain amino acid ABC transporter permease [Acetobacteraceae bacterium]|nr:branched-chain amino acid ABC transporter permease [Acetobacteraceae bacterium]